MATTQDCLDIVRRRIGDDILPYTFTDDTLKGYLGDAVSHVEIEFFRGIEFQYGEFVFDTGRYNPLNGEVTMIDSTLFAIKAHYLIALREKDLADRNNFLMKKGRLSLDNSGQSKDHKDTLELLDKEYRRALYQARNYSNGGNSIKGVRLE